MNVVKHAAFKSIRHPTCSNPPHQIHLDSMFLILNESKDSEKRSSSVIPLGGKIEQ